ncbi:GntR family transcriptional regulator [Tistrella bauzanensis]
MTTRDPAYLKAKTYLLDGLDDGRWKPGDKLPSERDLARLLVLDRNLVRHALMSLEGEGLVMRLDRRGWFATPPRLAFDPGAHVNFARAARDQGRVPSWASLDHGMVPLPGPEARMMGLVAGSMALRTLAWGRSTACGCMSRKPSTPPARPRRCGCRRCRACRYLACWPGRHHRLAGPPDHRVVDDRIRHHSGAETSAGPPGAVGG